ncbi:hypothetical protein C8R45DRAFT_82040 [Mycena sanguinolenta]|nr:hypothetical protein C8R45DRAFT_82040 [Mycena sanguinolenta]
MSAEAFHARIEELSSEIDLYKARIKKLRRDRCLVQRQLNSVNDPVARLPPEIASEIFLQCLPPAKLPMVGARNFPMRLQNVCSNWNTIALSTPALWTDLQICFPCPEDLAHLLPIWFQRAGSLPLTISLRGARARWRHSVCAAVWGFAERLGHLEICVGNDSPFDDYDDDADSVTEDEWVEDVFGGRTLGSLPLLKTLSVNSFTPTEFFGLPQIMQLLRSASNMTEFKSKYEIFRSSGATIPNVVHPTLRSLTVERSPHTVRLETVAPQMLTRLSLPGLEVLTIPMSAIYVRELLSFLERSAPPLCQLVMAADAQDPPTSEVLHQCLRLIPSLPHFEIQWPDQVAHIVPDLIAALADSSSSLLLPNLQSLTIDVLAGTMHISQPFWRALLRAVSSRRFQLRLVGPHFRIPSADIMQAFKELDDDGVEVYVGNKDHNFVGDRRFH